MVKFSELYPLSSGGGSANIAGFEWSEKTADFTAEVNKGYYCDTALDNILLSLPNSPSTGDDVAFFLIGGNKIWVTSSNKIKGNLLLTDTVKQISENYLIIVFTYVDSSTGWDYNVRYNPYISDRYIGAGLSYWQIEYNGNLAELQFDTGAGAKRFIAGNGVSSFTALSNVTNEVPSFASLSDGDIATGNNQRIGINSGATYCAISVVFSSPVNITKLWFYPQSSGGDIFHCPGTIRLRSSPDGVSYILVKEWQITTTGQALNPTSFSAQGLMQGQLNQLVV